MTEPRSAFYIPDEAYRTIINKLPLELRAEPSQRYVMLEYMNPFGVQEWVSDHHLVRAARREVYIRVQVLFQVPVDPSFGEHPQEYVQQLDRDLKAKSYASLDPIEPERLATLVYDEVQKRDVPLHRRDLEIRHQISMYTVQHGPFDEDLKTMQKAKTYLSHMGYRLGTAMAGFSHVRLIVLDAPTHALSKGKAWSYTEGQHKAGAMKESGVVWHNDLDSTLEIDGLTSASDQQISEIADELVQSASGYSLFGNNCEAFAINLSQRICHKENYDDYANFRTRRVISDQTTFSPYEDPPPDAVIKREWQSSTDRAKTWGFATVWTAGMALLYYKTT